MESYREEFSEKAWLFGIGDSIVRYSIHILSHGLPNPLHVPYASRENWRSKRRRHGEEDSSSKTNQFLRGTFIANKTEGDLRLLC